MNPVGNQLGGEYQSPTDIAIMEAAYGTSEEILAKRAAAREARSEPTAPAPQLPDDLRDEVMKSLQKVGTFVGTRGNLSALETFKEVPSKMALIFLTVGLGLVLWVMAEFGNYYEIRNNWAHYRCMPSIAPFAPFYGHDLTETMNFCISQQVREHAGGVIGPIYKGVEEVQQVVDGVFTKVEAVEGGIVSLLKGFENFVVNFMNSLGLLGTRIRMMFIRMKEIFQRVHGIFIAFAFAAISAITFGENLVCNPLVTFVAGIAGVDICCFAPETLVVMADGKTRRIADIHVGDALAGGSRVGATFVFDGRAVDMVNIHGIHVSTNHSLRGPDGSWIPAGEHSDAISVPSRDRIYCLTTSTNTISVFPLVGDVPLVFTDYEESSDPAVAAAAQAAAEVALNGSAGAPIADYSLGLDPDLYVLVDRGRWNRVEDLEIGDVLANGAVVTGIVREFCQDIRITRGGSRVAAAQLMRGVQGRGWFRAGTRMHDRAPAGILCHVFLNTNDGLTVANQDELWTVRDYQEWHGAATQDPYDDALRSKVDRGGRPGTPYPDDEDALLNPLFLATGPFS